MRPISASPRTMSLSRLRRTFTNGDETSWDDERAWLLANHPTYMRELVASIAREGIQEPVRLCCDERRVIDGHHRIVAAWLLGLTRVPVANAWDDDGWMLRTPDPRPIEVTT